ncbi:MAG TPA: XRE family transcriptional regulator [Ktedonobacteraceae bacterium]|nr:XRE family transcriptional regulator [Ktedonobacteraceae bacterium]
MVDLHITTNRLAQSVRAHRESRGFSIGTLSQMAGISKTSLSKIEAGQGNPSLEVLNRIANALNVPVGSLFGEEKHSQVHIIRQGEGQVVTSDSGLTSRTLLVDGRSHRMSIYEMHLPAQASYRALAHLPGAQEFLFCLEGDICLGPEEQEVHLQPGDAICFAADLPHTYTSINGARALLVMQYPPAQGIVP